MKHLRSTSLLAAALWLGALAPDAFACSCAGWQGPFLKVAPTTRLVVRGRVLRHTGTGATETEMDIEVLETFAGETKQKVVSVSGDPGNQCRPYVSRFPVGTEWVLALDPAAKTAEEARGYLLAEPDKGDYAISSCATYWLAVKDGEVIGSIESTADGDEKDRYALQSMSLEELRSRFNALKKKSSGK